jgi:hypothetical protein
MHPAIFSRQKLGEHSRKVGDRGVINGEIQEPLQRGENY